MWIRITYSETFASTSFGWSKEYGSYSDIKKRWESEGYAEVSGQTRSGRKYAMKLLSDGTAVVAIDGEGEIESRDYLDLAARAWGGDSTGKSMKVVQSNAYPYSNPVLTDDGEMLLYISDNDNAKVAETVVSYAVKSGDGYENKKAVVTSTDNVLARSYKTFHRLVTAYGK